MNEIVYDEINFNERKLGTVTVIISIYGWLR